MEEDSSDDKDETTDKIIVEDVLDEDKEILEEATPLGCVQRVQTPPDFYNADFSNIKYK